jgi:cytochrome P450
MPARSTAIFVPPAPVPRRRGDVPSALALIRGMLRNPLAVWGEPSYEDKWIFTTFLNERTLIVNDPGLIRHVLVENAANYRFGTVRQLIIRPILRDGLLSAEGEVWKRSRKAMAPVFAPRNLARFARTMQQTTEAFCTRFDRAAASGETRDMARDMTDLTFEVLSATLFSGGIVGHSDHFSRDVEELLHSMGRVDPFDVLKLPPWIPRLTRLGGRKLLQRFRNIVDQTMAQREALLRSGAEVPEDLLTLLLRQEHPEGLTREEIKDNIITFIGAGHETTARALGWTLFCLASSAPDMDVVQAEIDQFFAKPQPPPEEWLAHLPKTRAAFDEAIRLYPPAPIISRAAIADDHYGSLKIEAGTTVLVLPWTLHRHRTLWDEPNAFLPQRFWPENRDKIDRYQYLPFGAGPRICIGAAFAMQEAVIILAILLHRFTFTCTPDCKPWPVQKLTTQPEGGIPMTIARRQPQRPAV